MPLAFTIADASVESGIGRSKLYEFIAAGDLQARKAHGRTLIMASELTRFLESLPTLDPAACKHVVSKS